MSKKVIKKIVGVILITCGFAFGCIGSYECGFAKGESNRDVEGDNSDSVVELD